MSTSVADKLDDLLQRNAIDTRAGLQLMGELVRDAFRYIEAREDADEANAEMINSFKTRLTNVENGLNQWMTLRKKESEKAEEDRRNWRRAIFAPLVLMAIAEIARALGWIH